MKGTKLIIALLISTIFISACGSTSSNSTASSSSDVATSETPVIEEVRPFDSPIINDVLSGSGDKIGEWIEFDFSKSDFQSLTYADLKDFHDNILSKYSADGFNYCSIVFEDETGICYPGCNASIGMYGVLEDGSIMESYGYVQDNASYYFLTDDSGEPVSDTTTPNGINGIE